MSAPIDARTGQRATCNRCPSDADRTLGSDTLCDDCAEAILRPIRERRARELAPEGFDGIGTVVSPADHWGRGWHHLECDQCAATWIGRAGEPCRYCAGRYDRMLTEQAQVTLRPELPDVTDPRRPATVQRWGERLARAVAAGVVDETAATAAYEREVSRAAA